MALPAYHKLIPQLVRYLTAATIGPDEFSENWEELLSSVRDEVHEPAAAQIGDVLDLYGRDFPVTFDEAEIRSLWGSALREDMDDETTSAFLTAVGNAFLKESDPVRALQRYAMAWGLDPTNSDAVLYVANLLRELPERLDPKGAILEELISALFEEKGEAYLAGDLENIVRFHTLLGSIFERRGEWGSLADPRSALFQWHSALRAQQELVDQQDASALRSVPGLHEKLAAAYRAVGDNARAQEYYAEAAEQFEALGNQAAADRVLAYADDLGTGVEAPAIAEWKFALGEIEGSVQDAFAQEFKQRIEEKSNGDITVTIYPYGQLGTSGDLTELAANGAIQIANASPGHLGSLIPEVQVFSLMYLLSENNEVNKRILSESPTIYEDLQEEFSGSGLQLLAMYPEGDEVWTANKEIRSPEDLQGFKMRTMVSPMLTEAYSALGASPTPMPYGEVYGALQLGMVDGQVNPIFAIEEMKFYEVQDYMIWAGQQQVTTTVIANQDWYDSLPDEQRQMLDETMTEVTEWIFDVQEQYNQERLERIKEANPDIQMIELTPEERAVFEERAKQAYDKYVELVGEDGKQILESLQAEIEQAEQELGVERGG